MDLLDLLVVETIKNTVPIFIMGYIWMCQYWPILYIGLLVLLMRPVYRTLIFFDKILRQHGMSGGFYILGHYTKVDPNDIGLLVREPSIELLLKILKGTTEIHSIPQ